MPSTTKNPPKPPKNSSIQDLCYYKFLHFLGKCFAVLPNFQLNTIDIYSPNVCYALFILLTLCGIYAFGTYGKVTYMHDSLAPSVFLTEISSDAVIVLTNIVTITRINIFKGPIVCKFLANLMQIDRELRQIDESLVTYPSRQFVGELSFTLIFFLVFLIYNTYIWMVTVGWMVFRYFGLRDVQNFQVLITAILLSSYATAIKNRVHILNEILLKTNPHADWGAQLFFRSSAAMRNLSSKDFSGTVKHLRSVFVDLMQAVDDYNNVFGWVHLVLYVNIVMTLLNPINLALVYGVGDKKFPAGDFDFRLVLLCVIWAALPWLIATCTFSACDKCIAEIKRIPNICNCLASEFDEENEATCQLEKLAQQVANSCPEFTAAGFFTVNYNIYFSLMGSITTYLIVLIQFR